MARRTLTSRRTASGAPARAAMNLAHRSAQTLPRPALAVTRPSMTCCIDDRQPLLAKTAEVLHRVPDPGPQLGPG
eukprot:2549316-Pyramimonas_sp.AAC.1